MAYSLKVILDTWLKQSTVQGSQLPDEHKQYIDAGMVLPIATYEVVSDNHLKITLGVDQQGRQVAYRGMKTWFVYRPTVQVVQAGRSLTLPALTQVEANQADLQVKFILDTWLKLSTNQASQVADDQKQYMTAGAILPISAYEMVEKEHLQLTFGKDKTGNQVNFRGRNTWYVYRPTIEILRDSVAIAITPNIPSKRPAPLNQASEFELKIVLDTWLKFSPKQSTDLPEAEKFPVFAGTVIPLASYQSVEADHLEVSFGQDSQGKPVFYRGRNTWYVYRPMVQILRNGKATASVFSRQMNQEGLALLKSFEGVRLDAYQDVGGVWTIGYGHTERAFPGLKITQAQADAWLEEDLRRFEDAVDDLVNGKVNDNQFSALVSFVYNIGEEAFANSTLLRFLNRGNVQAAADEFPRWNRVGEQIVFGLTRRRNAERALFLGQDWRSIAV